MAEFLLQALIIVGVQRPGQIMRLRREVFAANQIGLDEMTVSGQIVEQTAEAE